MKNSDAVVELRGLVQQEDKAAWVSNLWTKWNDQRSGVLAMWSEVDQYLFSVDTSTTANSSLPWTHNSRNPKLTQIRDNLHANYISSIFPNDKWLTWVAYSKDAAKKDKAKVITSYMENKAREGNLQQTVSRLLYDYIDKGVCFAQPSFETRYKETEVERVTSFVGPTASRIDPKDIVFNPTASSFNNTPKVVRSLVTLGELKKMSITHPEYSFWEKVLERRLQVARAAQTYSSEDWNKASQYAIDGFGNLQEYYISDTVEILEFYGDWHDAETGTLETNRMITIADRSIVARDIQSPTYGGDDGICMAGWRLRQDNLWAQGPLDNLIGMQYQLDHYLNMAANALDLKVMPPKKVIGDVEEFDWAPNSLIHIDESGDVQEMAQQFGDVVSCLEFIRQLEERMEMYSGAPREAMGIRTPGEKTAFEVQSLENAAGRIFQEKVIQFEYFLEDLLNGMLESAHRNMEYLDLIRIVDDDLKAVEFREITKEDITASGVLRPIGARHFAQKAQELQNLVGVFSSPMVKFIEPHTSGEGLTRFINDIVDLRAYDIFRKNVAVEEAQETQGLAQQAQQDAMTDISPEEMQEQILMQEAQGNQ